MSMRTYSSTTINNLRQVHEKLSSSLLDQPIDRQMRLFFITRFELLKESAIEKTNGSPVPQSDVTSSVQVWAVNQLDDLTAVEQLLRRVAVAAKYITDNSKIISGNVYAVRRDPCGQLLRAQALYCLKPVVEESAKNDPSIKINVRVSYVDLGQEETIEADSLIEDVAGLITLESIPPLARSYQLQGALVLPEQYDYAARRALNRYLYRVLHGSAFYDEAEQNPRPQVDLFDPDTGRSITDLLIYREGVALQSPLPVSPVYGVNRSFINRSNAMDMSPLSRTSSVVSMTNGVNRLLLNGGGDYQKTPVSNGVLNRNNIINSDQVDASTPHLPKVVEAEPKPEVTKPEVGKPEVVKPEVAKPEVAKPIEPKIKVNSLVPRTVSNSALKPVSPKPVATVKVDEKPALIKYPEDNDNKKQLPETRSVPVAAESQPIENVPEPDVKFANLADLAVEKVEELYLTAMTDKTTLFGQLTRLEQDKLFTEHDSIQQYVASNKPPGVSSKQSLDGKMILAPWSGEYYRAKVLSSSSGNEEDLSVLFVDWGNVDTVKGVDCHPLPDQFATNPQFGIRIDIGTKKNFTDAQLESIANLVKDDTATSARIVFFEIDTDKPLGPAHFFGKLVHKHGINKKFLKIVDPERILEKSKSREKINKEEAVQNGTEPTKPSVTKVDDAAKTTVEEPKKELEVQKSEEPKKKEVVLTKVPITITSSKSVAPLTNGPAKPALQSLASKPAAAPVPLKAVPVAAVGEDEEDW